ncbi:hypothetical protein QFZ24_006953 [Streptomyces phaeochromogenes]|nr:hypothetical protein [Streptomyces phaeochromogenes]
MIRSPLSRSMSHHVGLLLRRPVEEDVAAPHVVDEDVEAALFAVDAVDEGAYLVGLQVVRRDRDAPAGGARGLVDQFGRPLDGLGGPADLADVLAGRASRHVDRGSGAAQFHRHGPSGASCGTPDQGDLSFELPAVFLGFRLCCRLHGPSIAPNTDICCRTFRGHVRA